MHPRNVRANLTQRHRKQIQPLKTDCFIGSDQHPAAFVQPHQAALGPHRGFRQRGALCHHTQRLILFGRHRGNGAIIHPIKLCHRRGNMGQKVFLFHTLAHRPRHKFRKQHCRLRSVEKLLHHIAQRTFYLDIKALQLTLIRVQSLQRRAAVLLAGIQFFQNAGKTPAALSIHALFQLYRVKMICHRFFLLKA